MGSFNVSCGVSRLSIGPCTPTVLLPLVPADDILQMQGALIVSNDGAQAFFSPLTLPIMGSYNDYGTLEDIVESKHTEAIENYYGIPINKFVDYVTRPDDGKPNQHKGCPNPLPELIAGMFIHGNIYNFMAKGLAGEFGESPTVGTNQRFTTHLLKDLGFKHIFTDKAHKQYPEKYVHKSLEGISIWSDHQYAIELEILGQPQLTTCYHLNNLIEKITELHMPIPPVFTKLAERNTYELGFTHALLDYAQQQKDMAQLAALEAKQALGGVNSANAGIILKTLLAMRSESRSNLLNLSYHNSSLFLDVYGACLKDLKKEFVDYKNFESACFSVNTLLMPSTNGYQCGNRYASQALSQQIALQANLDLSEYQKQIAE